MNISERLVSLRLAVQSNEHASAVRDATGRLLFWNQRYLDLFGLEAKDLAAFDQVIAHFADPQAARRARRVFGPAANLEGPSESTFQIVQRDGSCRWVRRSGALVLDFGDGLRLRQVALDDVTDEVDAAEQSECRMEALLSELSHRAYHDDLTGLGNRRLLNERLEEAWFAGRALGALLFIDIDRFKTVNDSLGHHAGDCVLRHAASRLTNAAPSGAVVARVGGDEFVVALEAASERLSEATDVAERVLAEVSTPMDILGQEIFVGVSIGIASPDPADVCHDDIMRRADLAMYEAKRRGGRRYCLDKQELSRPSDSVWVEGQLRHAIERDQLRLYFQPEVHLATGAVVGAEALMRWQHPDLGLLDAGQFIPLAERTGLIVELGQWALRRACREAAAWLQTPEFGHCVVRVNVSAHQLGHPKFVSLVADELRAADIPPDLLCLELTETALMAEPVKSSTVLHGIHALGVRIAIDDFGIGHCSLAHVNDYPIDVIKIDRTFITNITTERSAMAIAASVVTLAKWLDLEVVAEGIETPQQARQLMELGVERGQGFLYARPSPTWPNRSMSVPALSRSRDDVAGRRLWPPVSASS